MLPLWVLGHSLSRAALVNVGLRLMFTLSGLWQKGSLAVQLPRALPHLALSTLHPSLGPRASRPQKLIVEPSLPLRQILGCLGGSDFTLWQSTSDIPFLERRTSAPEHDASVNRIPKNLTMIFLSQEISQVLSEALSQTAE